MKSLNNDQLRAIKPASKNLDKSEPLVNIYSTHLSLFSSEYGRPNSVSYVARNLIGEPSIYPQYGDYSNALVFRTFGQWWKDFEITYESLGFNHIKYFGCSTSPKLSASTTCADDFVEVSFDDTALYLVGIHIFETYHPGAIIRIMGLSNINSNTQKWFCLWHGPALTLPEEPRVFKPSIVNYPHPTNLVRIEVNQRHLTYYTELDSVQIIGYRNANLKSLNEISTTKAFKNMSLNSNQSSNVEAFSSLLNLPNELIYKIGCDLDFESICALSCTCTFLRKFIFDNVTTLKLKPYWHRIDNDILSCWLLNGYKNIRCLDLSWCGPHGMITGDVFSRIISCIGIHLRILILNSCDFISWKVISMIGETCHNLLQLDLENASYSSIDEVGTISPEDKRKSIQSLKNLKLLRSLNVSHSSMIILNDLSDIIEEFTDLEELNIGSIGSMREYFQHFLDVLSKCCPKIRNICMWRVGTMKPENLDTLVKLKRIENLDLGWCSCKFCPGFLSTLAESYGSNLRRLILTKTGSVVSSDLLALTKFCPNLEQLDILGARIDKFSVTKLLESCSKMRLLDISFCSNISETEVEELVHTFKRVSIKRSFN